MNVYREKQRREKAKSSRPKHVEKKRREKARPRAKHLEKKGTSHCVKKKRQARGPKAVEAEVSPAQQCDTSVYGSQVSHGKLLVLWLRCSASLPLQFQQLWLVSANGCSYSLTGRAMPAENTAVGASEQSCSTGIYDCECKMSSMQQRVKNQEAIVTCEEVCS